MVNDIIALIKKSSIPNVVFYADGAKVPPLPYVVVKPEAGVIEHTRAYRITVHHEQGYFTELEEYVLHELDELLAGTVDGQGGARFKLYPNGFTDVTPDPDGDSIFMERIYYTPLAIRR